MSKTADRGKPSEDWDRFDAMSAGTRRAAALADPEAKPLASEDFKRMRRTPHIKIIRRALGLSQEEFRRGSIFRSAHCAIGSRGGKSRMPPVALISR